MNSRTNAVESTNRLETHPRTTVHQRLSEAREAHHVPERCFIHLAPADDPHDSPKRPSPQTGYDRVAFDAIDDGNYGICPDGGLVIIDIDDGDGPDIPRTFSTSSPHNSGHRYVVSDPYVAEAVKYAFGAENPTFGWGELKAGNTKNTHVVGAGSVIERCDKDTHDCSQAGEGAYTIDTDLPIAYVPAGELIDILDNAAPTRSATVPADGFHDDGRPVGVLDADDGTDGPQTDISGRLTKADKQLVETAKNAKNGDKFSRLWDGNTSIYPSHSEADLALCNFLAFYCQKDSNRMARMFRASGLMRPKWKRDDYRSATIKLAISGAENTYNPSTSNILRDHRPETSNITRDKVFSALLDLTLASSSQLTEHEDVDRSVDQVRRSLNTYEDVDVIDWVRVGRKVFYYFPGSTIPDARFDQLDIDRNDIDIEDRDSSPTEVGYI